MRCNQCGRESEACDRGWVVVLPDSSEDERIFYCPACMNALVAAAKRRDARGGA
jgi:hypothetical protein